MDKYTTIGGRNILECLSCVGVQWLTIVRYGYELLDMGGPTKEAAVPCTDVWLTDHMCIKMATKCKVQET